MPFPEELEVRQAVKLQRQLLDRVIAIYSKNSSEVDDVQIVLKICQCVADDEFFQTHGLEPE